MLTIFLVAEAILVV